MKLSATLLCILFLAGCATTTEQVPVVKTVEVKVPVIKKAKLPAALANCGHTTPGFRFYDVAGSDDVVIKADDQPAFQDWVNEKQRCINTLQDWAR